MSLPVVTHTLKIVHPTFRKVKSDFHYSTAYILKMPIIKSNPAMKSCQENYFNFQSVPAYPVTIVRPLCTVIMSIFSKRGLRVLLFPVGYIITLSI